MVTAGGRERQEGGREGKRERDYQSIEMGQKNQRATVLPLLFLPHFDAPSAFSAFCVRKRETVLMLGKTAAERWVYGVVDRPRESVCFVQHACVLASPIGTWAYISQQSGTSWLLSADSALDKSRSSVIYLFLASIYYLTIVR